MTPSSYGNAACQCPATPCPACETGSREERRPMRRDAFGAIVSAAFVLYVLGSVILSVAGHAVDPSAKPSHFSGSAQTP